MAKRLAQVGPARIGRQHHQTYEPAVGRPVRLREGVERFEVIGLLPSVAKVVRKFDYFEHKLSVTRQGPSARTYLRESVTEVRVPKGT